MPPSTPRDRYIAWLRWFMRTHPSVVPTQRELARRIGAAPSALTAWFAPGSDRAPSFENLVAIRELTGLPLDLMISSDPPEDETACPTCGQRSA